MTTKNIMLALGIITELATGIAQITNALQSGMTPEQLDEFIKNQNKLQEDLRNALKEE